VSAHHGQVGSSFNDSSTQKNAGGKSAGQDHTEKALKPATLTLNGGCQERNFADRPVAHKVSRGNWCYLGHNIPSNPDGV